MSLGHRANSGFGKSHGSFLMILQGINSSPVASKWTRAPQAMQKWHIHSAIGRGRPVIHQWIVPTLSSHHYLHTTSPCAQEVSKDRFVRGCSWPLIFCKFPHLTDRYRAIQAPTESRQTPPRSNVFHRKSLSQLCCS